MATPLDPNGLVTFSLWFSSLPLPSLQPLRQIFLQWLSFVYRADLTDSFSVRHPPRTMTCR